MIHDLALESNFNRTAARALHGTACLLCQRNQCKLLQGRISQCKMRSLKHGIAIRKQTPHVHGNFAALPTHRPRPHMSLHKYMISIIMYVAHDGATYSRSHTCILCHHAHAHTSYICCLQRVPQLSNS